MLDELPAFWTVKWGKSWFNKIDMVFFFLNFPYFVWINQFSLMDLSDGDGDVELTNIVLAFIK